MKDVGSICNDRPSSEFREFESHSFFNGNYVELYTSILRSAEDRNLALQFVHYRRNLPRAVTLHTLGLQSRPVDSKVCRWPVGVPEPRVPLSAQAGPTRILRDQGIEHERLGELNSGMNGARRLRRSGTQILCPLGRPGHVCPASGPARRRMPCALAPTPRIEGRRPWAGLAARR